MATHPYREQGRAPDPVPPEQQLPADDFAVAAMLLLVGGLGIAIGVSVDRATELSLGLLLVALAARVGIDARRAGSW